MWDARYAEPGFAYGTAPNDFLRSEAPRIEGPVLCLAEGEGRNATFLAGLGLEVHGVDLSEVAVDKTRRLAAERGVVVEMSRADLADYDLGEARWGAVVAIFAHLPPPLRAAVNARIVRSLRPGGRLVLEAYTPRQLAFGTGGPPVAAMLYEPEDLRAELAGLRFDVFHEIERDVHEGRYHNGRSAVLQISGVREAR